MIETRQRAATIYPQVGLATAIEQARTLWLKIQVQRAPRDIIAAGLAEQADDPVGEEAFAAQLAYGLLEEIEREYQFTARAIAIFQSDRPLVRAAAIRDAAMTPAIGAAVWSAFLETEPKDAELREFLTGQGVADAMLAPITAALRETAGLFSRIRLGDGLAADSVGAEAADRAPQRETADPSGVKQDEIVFSQGRLTADLAYRLLVSGDMRGKDLDRLIRLLSLQRQILAEEEDENADG